MFNRRVEMEKQDYRKYSCAEIAVEEEFFSKMGHFKVPYRF